MAVSILVQYDFDPTPYPSPFGYAFGTPRANASRLGVGNPPAARLLTASEEGGKILPPLCLAERGLGGEVPAV
ncbi:hypothetical protein SAMD00079811_25840 [Scytonema sp. HK-05]|nr:hypothetical protein SAMD00079811_25840 [Scytonema sp. HK-05]